MVILKFGESQQIGDGDFISPESIKADQEIHDRFLKLASTLKKIAPKAEDFLYFTAIMMHAAERSAYDENGDLRKDANGNDVKVWWDIDEKTGSWKWRSSDPSILPYKNANGDVFPESQLKLAYKKWIGKPLCKDHQSSSVDGMRGIIIDTYWDDKHKRIISLCALDKIGYPDLARHVQTRVAGDVSMGCGVEKSICSECGNVATTEAEYCSHVRSKTAYGEINVGLNPIELSIVMNGADKKAKILEVLAAAQTIEEKVLSSNIELNMNELMQQYKKLAVKVENLEREFLTGKNDNNFALKRTASVSKEDESYLSLIKHKLSSLENILAAIQKNAMNTEDLMEKNIKRGYWQGTEEPKPGQKQYPAEEADKIRNTQDSHMKLPLTDLSPAAGTEIPKQDLEVKKQVARASVEERRAIRAAAVEKARASLNKESYMLGTEEPKTYPVDPLAEKARKEDRQMLGANTTGTYPEDAKLKEQLCRASLKARLVTGSNAADNRWEIFDKNSGKMVFAASFAELAGNKPVMYKPLYEKDFARHIMSTIKSVGLAKASTLFKSAQAAPADPAAPAAPAPAPDAAAPAPAPEAAPAPDAGFEPEESLPGDLDAAGKPEGDVNAALASITKALQEMGSVISEVLPSLEEAAEAIEGEGKEFGAAGESAAINPEQTVDQALAEIGGSQEGMAPSVASLNKLRIVLNAGLNKGLTDSIKALGTCKEEISLLTDAAKSRSVNVDIIKRLAVDAQKDAKKAIKDAEVLKMAFVKYAKSVYNIEKRAARENAMKKMAMRKAMKVEARPVKADDKFEDNTQEVVEAKKENMVTSEERKASRHKLAATVAGKLQYSDMLQKAHPKGSTKLEGISDTKEAVFEDLPDVAKQMEEAVSHEPKVKKAAEKLDKLIRSGKIDASRLDSLVKEGLDSEVASYWKKYYGQVDGGGEFAAALLKDYSGSVSKQKKAELEENIKAKTIRAFDLAYQMAKVGLCGRTETAIRKEAEKILEYDDNAYSSMKRVVEHHTKVMGKTASSNSVQVGVALDGNGSDDSVSSLYQQLSLAFNDMK